MEPTSRRGYLLTAFHLAVVGGWFLGETLYGLQLSRLEAGMIALGLSFVHGLVLGRWNDRFASGLPPSDLRRLRVMEAASVAMATLFLAVTVLTGPRHDYILFMEFWSGISLGHDPWYLAPTYWGIQPPNAYGPLFNLFAWPAQINTLIPKLVFASSYVLAASALTTYLSVRPRISGWGLLGLMAWTWNPFVWVEVAIRGHFDVMMGLASVAAVHFRRERRDLQSATALSLGVLLKYLPIALLPFIALDGKRIRYRLVIVSTLLIALGLGLSCLIWGRSTFYPLRFAATRSSTYLSIFRFMRGRFSPLPTLGLAADLDWLSLPAIALGLGLAWWWCRSRNVDPATSAVLSVLVTLLFYRNGFPQYQIVLMMLASYWVVATWRSRIHRPALVLSLLGYLGWIVAFDVVYWWIGDSSTTFEDAVGLPTFALGIAFVVCLVRSEPSRA